MDREKLVKEAREVLVDILQDCLDENKKVIKRMQMTIVLLVILLVGSFAYYLYSFYAFLEQYDYENTVITQDIDTGRDGNIADSNKIEKHK